MELVTAGKKTKQRYEWMAACLLAAWHARCGLYRGYNEETTIIQYGKKRWHCSIV